MREKQAVYPVALMCRLLGVSTSGSYAWLNRKPSRRALSAAALTERIEAIHRWSDGPDGAPRIHNHLRDEGIRVGKKRVARLMQKASVAGVSRQNGVWTTRRDKDTAVAPDLVKRAFSADTPDRLGVADITSMTTWSGFLYLAVVLDALSRRIVGWAMAAHLATELVGDALDMAVGQRRADGVIHHSDQGSQ